MIIFFDIVNKHIIIKDKCILIIRNFYIVGYVISVILIMNEKKNI